MINEKIKFALFPQRLFMLIKEIKIKSMENRPYHKYIFDLKNRKFTGKFEEMYQNEDKEGFDSWHQDEVDTLRHDLILTVLKRNEYEKILDVGCGKGTFTNRLKNELGDDVDITAIDISPTAISKARKRYSRIKFLVRDASNLKFEFGEESFDLIVCSEIFWYILKDIHKILRDFKKILIRGGHILVVLYIPENPIGKEVIGTAQDCKNIIRKYFNIEEVVKYEVNDEDHVIILGRKK